MFFIMSMHVRVEAGGVRVGGWGSTEMIFIKRHTVLGDRNVLLEPSTTYRCSLLAMCVLCTSLSAELFYNWLAD